MVREAFRARGHDAWSCDLLDASDGSAHHLKGNVLDFIYDYDDSGYCYPWDLMIAHPPCTYLSVSGMHWNTRRPERAQLTEQALAFVRELMDAPIPRICVENPVSIISTRIRKPDQIIQPWMFGHPESKKTCLWLKNLPSLLPTNVLTKPLSGIWQNQTPSGQNKLGPSPMRAMIRSITYRGIAEAMAHQWGSLPQ